MAKTFLGIRLEVLLTWYGHLISLGSMEGTNTKIKTMKRQVYDYRDMEFFGIEILSFIEVKCAFG